MALGDGVISGLEFPHLLAVSALHPAQPRVADREGETRESRERAGLRWEYSFTQVVSLRSDRTVTPVSA